MEDPLLHKDQTSQNPQPTSKPIHIEVQLSIYQSVYIVLRDESTENKGMTIYAPYLLFAAWAIMIFVPKAVH